MNITPEQIQTIVEIVLIIASVALSFTPVKQYLGKRKSNQIAVIVQVVYAAIANARRLNDKRTEKKMTSKEITSMFEKAVIKELKANGIKPTPEVIEQSRMYAEAKHMSVKGAR